MLDPLAATFDFLASTDNTHAVDVLLPALDSEDDRIRTAATRSLLKRRSPRGHVELVRRLDRLTPDMRAALARTSAGFESSLRQCLLHGDDALRHNALQFVGFAKDFSQVPTLLHLLEDPAAFQFGKVADVLQELVNHLYDHLHQGPDQPPVTGVLRDASRIRDQVLASLDQSLTRFESHHCEAVIESILALADVEHFAIKKLIRQVGHPCRDIAERLLLTSTHPGVMAKTLDFMGLNYPPHIALQVLKQRTDPEFIAHLLRNLPRKLTAAQQHNYKKIESIAWLQQYPLRLEVVPPGLQKRLVTFVDEISLRHDEKRAVIDWIVKFGAHEARQAATETLHDASDYVVQDIVVDGLYSEDPEIQAWATSQLRARGIPQAFSLLIERLDSPLAEVREAARAELGDFDLKRVIDLCDQVDPHTCLLAGKLLQKIDPQVLSKLRTEMTNPMRSKRIRAIKSAQAIHVQDQVTDTLIKLLEDEDAVVRRTAVEVLATLSSPGITHALTALLDDPSPRVRHEAERALSQRESAAGSQHRSRETQS